MSVPPFRARNEATGRSRYFDTEEPALALAAEYPTIVCERHIPGGWTAHPSPPVVTVQMLAAAGLAFPETVGKATRYRITDEGYRAIRNGRLPT